MVPMTQFGSSGNLSQALGSIVTVSNADGYAGATFTLTCPSGSMVALEATYDGFNWFSTTFRRIGNDGYIQQTSGVDSYIGSIAGAQSFRARVIQSGFTTGTLIGSLQRYVSTLEGIENGPPNDFWLNVAENKVAGYDQVNKFGRNPDINIATVPEDIWNGGGIYAGFPVNVFERVRVTSNATGDSGTGFGARTITIFGLDAGFNPQSETLTLAGLVPVTGVGTYSRVNAAYTVTAGASGANLGELTCQHVTTTADVFFRMPTGTNQTYVSAYTVPAGKSAYIRAFHATVNRGFGTGALVAREADIALAVRPSGSVFRLRRPTNLSTYSPLDYSIEGGLQIPEKSDIVIRCLSASTDATDISCGYDMVVVDN